jgi:hypothetical protein
MGKKLKKTLLVLLLAICALFVFAGCELGETLDDALALRGLDAQVTYYANGGRFESNNQKKKTDFYYKSGSKAYDYGTGTFSGSAKIDRANFEFDGWYFVVEVLDEENGICELGEKVDFSVPLQEGDHWLVAAKWKALSGLKIVMVSEDGKTVNGTANDKNKTPVSYENGAMIAEIEYDYTTDKIASAPKEQFKVTGKTHTFYTYYDDPECTQRTVFPITRGDEQRTIYAKYLAGEWTVVADTGAVRSMFSNLQSGTNKRYCLLGDIDCSKIEVVNIRKMNGEINGNGYTLKGLKIIGDLSGKNNRFGLFGEIGETAKITDLTIENVSMTAKFSTQSFHADVYFLFASKHADATISNVKVSGSLTITGPDSCVADNLMKDGAIVYTNCLYGGYDTDEAYVNETNGEEFVVSSKKEEMFTIALN